MDELLTEDRRVVLEAKVSNLEQVGIQHTGDQKIKVSDLRAALNTIDAQAEELAERDKTIANYEQAIDRLSKGMALTLPLKDEKPDEFGLTPSQYPVRVAAPYESEPVMKKWLVLDGNEQWKGTVEARNSRQALIAARDMGLLTGPEDFVREV